MARRVYLQAKDVMSRPTVRYVDASWSLGDLALGRREHMKERIPGSVFFDVEALSGEITDKTGRHPLPSWEKWAAWLQGTGLKPDDFIVAYDNTGGPTAACRLWWMLTVSGYKDAYILSGGYPQWKADGGPVDTAVITDEDIEKPREGGPIDLPCSGWDQKYVVDYDYVKACSEGGHKGVHVVDCRTANRWGSKDKPEGPDPKPGNVAGSVNHPFTENYVAVPGQPKSPEELKARCLVSTGGEESAENTVLYCGSGVTACCTASAFVEAGLGLPRIYTGSWSEWCNKHTF
eukprot:TRINITY_DN22080_c0_g1_i1.p2 TRINITY_DN22080_c0_g1~~TRINITY_DN22080_c0_g1_i1.p2  ORF type:complete len:290 (+),score=96.49 TRINITY_DN22080_c0_g1_i1:55-924(+)